MVLWEVDAKKRVTVTGWFDRGSWWHVGQDPNTGFIILSPAEDPGPGGGGPRATIKRVEERGRFSLAPWSEPGERYAPEWWADGRLCLRRVVLVYEDLLDYAGQYPGSALEFIASARVPES